MNVIFDVTLSGNKLVKAKVTSSVDGNFLITHFYKPVLLTVHHKYAFRQTKHLSEGQY